MKTWIQQALAGVVALGVGMVTFGPAAFAEDAPPPIMSYEVDIVSDYVVRGADQFASGQAFHKKDDGAVNVTPALQPSMTFFGPSGLSLTVWGSFALVDRADDNKKGFTGHGKLDEIDYTLQYDWSNKLGSFTAAIIQYTLLYTGGTSTASHCDTRAGSVTCSDVGVSTPIQPDFLIKWAMPFGKSMNPYFSYYANPVPGAEYAVLGISGGEALSWAASLGEKSGGPNDITASIGYAFGDLKVSGNLAYRPTPKLVGYPGGAADPVSGKPLDAGKYIDFNGKVKDYPSTIFWLTLAYTGSVSEPPAKK
jgi:hypothetical protein